MKVKLIIILIGVITIMCSCNTKNNIESKPKQIKDKDSVELKNPIKAEISDKSDKNEKIELIIVFKKATTLKDAKKLLDESKVKYRSGMDSSRGKMYFYATGDKFIITFKTNKEKIEFNSKFSKSDKVYEIYTPDWTVMKD